MSGTDLVDVQSKICKAISKLDAESNWANHPVVYRTCLEADSGADIMAVIEMDGPE